MAASPPFTSYSKLLLNQKVSKMVSPMRSITSQDSANNDSELPLVTDTKLTPRNAVAGVKLVLEQTSPSMTSPPEFAASTVKKSQSPIEEIPSHGSP